LKYVALIEQGKSGWGAYVPDLPGCVAVGPTRDFVEEKIREAIGIHLESLRAHGEKVPEATAIALTIDAA
jgi:predicted RNase H-like HicB family nuclease